MSGPRLGVTLFSFTRAYREHRYTFEELIAKAGRLGLGPGLEIVGFQSIRSYPSVSDEFALRFRRLLDRAGLEPSALSGNIDAGLRADRLMTHGETVEVIEAQIVAAKKLGYPVLKVQFGASPDALEAALPAAEASGIKLAVEVHAPHHVRHPTMLALRERFEKLSTGSLGFVPDFGATMNAVPRRFVRNWREQTDTPPELVDLTLAAWERAHHGGDAFAERRQVLEAAEEMGAQSSIRYAWSALTLYGHQRPEDWAEIMPLVFHVHGKFYEIDDGGNEPSIPYDRLVRVFRDGGYSGYISSEWEGGNFTPSADPFALVQRHQELLRRHLETT
jgi:sugar phosphate isomerase/epimerase